MATTKTRIPHFDSDSPTFLVVDDDGAVMFGPAKFCACLQCVRGAGQGLKIVHKSDPSRVLPMAMNNEELRALAAMWDCAIGVRPWDRLAEFAADLIGFDRQGASPALTTQRRRFDFEHIRRRVCKPRETRKTTATN